MNETKFDELCQQFGNDGSPPPNFSLRAKLVNYEMPPKAIRKVERESGLIFLQGYPENYPSIGFFYEIVELVPNQELSS